LSKQLQNLVDRVIYSGKLSLIYGTYQPAATAKSTNASSYASILRLKGPKFGGDSTKLGFFEEVKDRAHRADDGEFDGLLKSHVDDELDWLEYYFHHPNIPTDGDVLFVYADPEDYPLSRSKYTIFASPWSSITWK